METAVAIRDQAALLVAVTDLLNSLITTPRPERPYVITLKEAKQLGFSGPWLREQIKAGKLTLFGRKISRYELQILAGKSCPGTVLPVQAALPVHDRC
jgi:hypothetical protein